jgi:hypothetical protein
MKARLITALLCVLGLGALSACANSDTTSPSPDDSQNDQGEYSSSALNLTSDTLGDTDVARMQFQITSDNCQDPAQDGQVDTQTKDLEDMMLPGGVNDFENKPLDEDSQHLFADAFFTVDATCDYDVVTTPLQQNGSASQDCEQAHKENVSIEDGQTTEILLINQCEGAERGGFDVVSSINHAPEIDNLEFDKFQASCPTGGEQVCVRASDPDSDPLEIVWETSDTGEFQGDIVGTQAQPVEGEDGVYESCATIRTNRAGSYGFEVTVYDLDGQGNRMEEVLAQQDARDAHESRDSLSFPVYSGESCQGRMATILMAIGDQKSIIEDPNNQADISQARKFIRQTSAWASPLTDKTETDVLYILDDNNPGEHTADDERGKRNVVEELEARFGAGNVTVIDEPPSGLSAGAADDFDLVWHSALGWPVDDNSSYDVLRDFAENGGGVVLESNDMGRTTQKLTGLYEPGVQRDMGFFHRLMYDNNGTTTCGDDTDNYSGNTYDVEFTSEPVSALEGLEGFQFEYDNDLDHVQYQGVGTILADATYTSQGAAEPCYGPQPAAVAITPLDIIP